MNDVSAASILQQCELLADGDVVRSAIKAVADKISEQLKDSNPLVLCIMNGGLVFAGQIIPILNFPLQVDYIHPTRYGSAVSGGKIEWLKEPPESVCGRVLLLLDDILDEGVTLLAVTEKCLAAGAKEIFTAVMVDKIHDRKVVTGMKPDFAALEINDRFLVGFGLDYKGYLRNADGIYAVPERKAE